MRSLVAVVLGGASLGVEGSRVASASHADKKETKRGGAEGALVDSRGGCAYEDGWRVHVWCAEECAGVYLVVRGHAAHAAQRSCPP